MVPDFVSWCAIINYMCLGWLALTHWIHVFVCSNNQFAFTWWHRNQVYVSCRWSRPLDYNKLSMNKINHDNSHNFLRSYYYYYSWTINLDLATLNSWAYCRHVRLPNTGINRFGKRMDERLAHGDSEPELKTLTFMWTIVIFLTVKFNAFNLCNIGWHNRWRNNKDNNIRRHHISTKMAHVWRASHHNNN